MILQSSEARTRGNAGSSAELRYNHNHDPSNGRFTSGGGGFSGVDKSDESGIIYGEPIQKSVGAKSPSYPIVCYPGTDIQVDFVIGSRPQYPPDHTMAGKNCKTHRQIDEIDRLVDNYNCDAANWQKEKARFEVYDEYGEIRTVELHWYQHPDIGKVEYKVKSKGGRVYVDEWD